MAGNQTVLVAARDASADRKLPGRSGGQVRIQPQSISSSMVHIANHPGMNKRLERPQF
jgi:hypothetical protein